MWWKYLLAVSVFVYIFSSHYIYVTRKQRQKDKRKGCTCKPSFWGAISHNCPVHSPFYIRNYRTIDDVVSTDKIYASGGTQEPICDNCLEEIKPPGYIIDWPFEEREGWCHTCGRMKMIRMMPERDLILWGKI